MAIQKFFLVGEDPKTALDIEVNPSMEYKTLQSGIATQYHICEAKGIAFQNDEGPLDSVESILDSRSPVGITVDGQAVKSPSGPEGFPFVGSFYEIFPDHLGNHARLFRKYGSVIKTTNLGKTTYLTDSPEVAAHALSESIYFTKLINSSHPLWGVKDNTAIFVNDTETENWRLAHKFLPPALSPKAVRHYTPLMSSTARASFPVFDELDQRGEAWSVYHYMLKLASQTIGKLTLDLDLGQFSSPEAPLHPIVTSIAEYLHLNKRVTSRGEWYRYLPFGDGAKLRHVQQEVYSIIQSAMDDCKATSLASGEKTDLPINDAALSARCVLDYILRAVDEKGEKLPEELVIGNMMIMTGAGFTTTSSLLSWLLYSLVTYEGNQDRLLQELVDNGITNSTIWDPDLANTLPFLDKFIKETQRLHNPSYQPGRTTKQEVIVPGGYRLPKDAVIISAIHAIHTNPNVWSNPLRFDPDRWDTDEVKKRHRCAYIPFATGPRGCIGFNFALQEVKVIVSELVYRYEFSREDRDAIEYDPEFQLIRPLNLYLRAKRRTTWPEPTPGSKAAQVAARL
ncbi:putative cytochrome P450 [Ascobolus immersus RN42]|uniref:Putative cytochrome P450 n=1 Tax=Ascobolus immersus RN42 TaxID=1160509 RepID=A0A3N4I8M8_ASCIM|nr:putative cytochrome P450 [Ascobolus immersus RN42]